MPEHFHALLWPTADANPSQIMQQLEDRRALFILKNLQENLGFAWCQKRGGSCSLASSAALPRGITPCGGECNDDSGPHIASATPRMKAPAFDCHAKAFPHPRPR